MKKLAIFFLCLAFFLAPLQQVFAITSNSNEVLSVVKINQFHIVGTNLFTLYSSGSGTIIDRNGYVLTNYHVIKDAYLYPDIYSPIICLTFSDKTDPTCHDSKIRFVKVDPAYDVALIQITEMYNPPTQSYIPALEWFANNNIKIHYVNIDRTTLLNENVNLGDEIQILGYPGVGGGSITYTKGTVSGFNRSQLSTGQTFPYQIKTDAKLNPGNSGGAAFDINNNYIGIPTAVAGGGGNIGYIIALPIINYVLKDYPSVGTQSSICLDTINGYGDSNGNCWCNNGYHWDSATNLCAKDVIRSSNPSTISINNSTGCRENEIWSSTIDKCVCINGYLPDQNGICVNQDDQCRQRYGSTAIYKFEDGICHVCEIGSYRSSRDGSCYSLSCPSDNYLLMLDEDRCIFVKGEPKDRYNLLDCPVVANKSTRQYYLKGSRYIKSTSFKGKTCFADEESAKQAKYKKAKYQ